MKLVAFAGSSSQSSINKTLVTYAASLVENAEVEVLDLNDFEMPIFSEDKEKALGVPEQVNAFIDKIKNADALIVSFAEHNGSYAVAYKNIFDWASRSYRKVYHEKPTVLLATSPGQGGASNVLSAAINSAPHFGMELKAHASVPSFYEVFDVDKGEPKDETTRQLILDAVKSLTAL